MPPRPRTRRRGRSPSGPKKFVDGDALPRAVDQRDTRIAAATLWTLLFTMMRALSHSGSCAFRTAIAVAELAISAGGSPRSQSSRSRSGEDAPQVVLDCRQIVAVGAVSDVPVRPYEPQAGALGIECTPEIAVGIGEQAEPLVVVPLGIGIGNAVHDDLDAIGRLQRFRQLRRALEFAVARIAAEIQQ